MHKLTLTGIAATLFLGTNLLLAQAPADEHAGHHPPGDATTASPAAAEQPTQATGPAAMPQMQVNMQRMRDLMTRIHASKDPAERQQLMQQHMKAMQDQMGMMRGMGSAHGGMMGGGMMMGGGKMTQEMKDHQAMHNHMEMMLDQMHQHQEAQRDTRPVK